MLQAILTTLRIMGWLGIALGILAIVNIVTGTMVNIWQNNEAFDLKKCLKGIIKVLVFYISAAIIAVAFTMLPFINEMITNAFGVVLLSTELLNTLSSIGVLGVVVSTIVVQAKKAIQGILALANICTGSNEEITWPVEEPTDEEESEDIEDLEA